VKFIETLKLALSAIWAHKLRSALTLLGMIIGVTAVVTVVSVIQGFNSYFDEKVAGIGSQSFSIRRFSFDDFKNLDTIAAAQRRNKDLTLAEFEYLRERTQLIDRLGARANATRAQIKRGSQILEDVPVDGATANMADIDNLDIADGRFFTESENDAQARVAYIGTDVANNLFPSGNAVGNDITIAGLPYRVIGVQTAKGTVFGVPQDNFITIPLKTYATNFGNLINQRSLYMVATAKPGVKFNDAVEEARFLMRTRRHLAAGDKDNFGILTPDAITGIRDRVLGTVSIVAIAVPSIALVVGGIVIMNIMLVSVTERTKEIGIRKAVGATRSNILSQFLIEAIFLTAIGGVAGLIVGEIASILMNIYSPLPAFVPLWAIVLGLGISAVVGIIFGLWPAWKAARLDPIEALRYE